MAKAKKKSSLARSAASAAGKHVATIGLLGVSLLAPELIPLTGIILAAMYVK